MGLYRNIALFFSFENILQKTIEIACIVEIIDLKEEKDYVNKYTLKIIKCKGKHELENKKVIGYFDKKDDFKPGDIVVVKGKIEKAEEAKNLYGFNNKNYLRQNKIYGIIKIDSSKLLNVKKDMYYIIGKINISIKEKINNLYDIKYQSVIGKILFGINKEIDKEIRKNFKDAGISHVLAISGLHISYVVLMINFILEKFINNIKIKNFLTIIILVFFLIITGKSPSCIRATMMTIFSLISKNVYRKNNVYISIVICFFILLFLNVYVIYNVGMWLSFLGTMGIILFQSFLKSIFKSKKQGKVNKIINIVLVSLSAQILIWPVILYCFNTISLTFFISNIFVSIIIGPIILLGYFSVIISYFYFPLAKVLVLIVEFLLELLFCIANICSKIPFSKIYIIGTNKIVLIIYYSFIFISILYFSKKKFILFKKIIEIRRFFSVKEIRLKIVKEIKLKILHLKRKFLNKSRKLISFIIVLVLIISGVHILNINNFELYFVDVGQGDCCVIKVDGKNIIIDAGEGNSDKYDYGENVVFQHLLKLGIKKIDYMIFSHMDSDHARRFNLYFK